MDVSEKLGLKKEIKTELQISKEEFIKILGYNTDKDRFISCITDLFSTSHTKYKGKINSDDFIIKCKTHLLRFSLNYPTVYGTLKQEKDKLIVHSKIKGMSSLISKAIYVYPLAAILITSTWIVSRKIVTMDLIILGIINLFFLTLLAIEFYRIRTGVNKVSNMLTTDFNKMTSKS